MRSNFLKQKSAEVGDHAPKDKENVSNNAASKDTDTKNGEKDEKQDIKKEPEIQLTEEEKAELAKK